MGTGSFQGGKERAGRDADPSTPSSAVGHERVELYRYSPYGGRTACTEPQCLYKGALYLFFVARCELIITKRPKVRVTLRCGPEGVSVPWTLLRCSYI